MNTYLFIDKVLGEEFSVIAGSKEKAKKIAKDYAPFPRLITEVKNWETEWSINYSEK